MPGHGKSGPERMYAAYGTNVEQVAGLVSLSGYEGGEPMKTGFSYGDPMAGTALVGAVCTALRKRRLEGEGSFVELSQRENLTMFVGEWLVDYSMNGEPREPTGNRNPLIAPHNRYASAGHDAWITIACQDDEEFRALATTIGQPELADDPRFATMAARKENEVELDGIIEAWTSQKGHYEAMHILQHAGVTAGAVLTIPELMSDPQLRYRGAWQEQTHPDAGTWEMETPPWLLGRTPGGLRIPPPGFGDHNQYVLRELLGLDEERIARLYEQGITADEPDASLHV
ncbi:MAG: CoA transferase [Dehalococcoidia bacterium]|nr:CoA transferase [Dehalococcoidia bacterium]